MLMQMWDGYWDNQLEMMNMRADEENGRPVGTVKGRTRIVWRFSSNEFWKNLGRLVSDPAFGLGG